MYNLLSYYSSGYYDYNLTALFIILIISIVILIILLSATARIADEKDQSAGLWIFLVLFFGIIPFIILLCLPTPTYTPTSSSGYSLTHRNYEWTCKNCGCKNGDSKTVCYNCKKPKYNRAGQKTETPVNSGWICPECKTKNNSFASHCSNCFREKP